jgi:MerR family transcriptional regulator, light-induced transcriptional regulator
MRAQGSMIDVPAPDTDEPALRIGELARRAGIPPATLRAWERRYGIVTPYRTEAGYRLYSADDERRLRAMVELITEGLAPAEAARQALRLAETAEPAAAPSPAPRVTGANGGGAALTTDLGELTDELLACLEAFDEGGAHRALDRALAAYGTDGLIIDLVLPVLRRAGALWSEGKLSVGQEHFGSQLLRGRLLALGRGWYGGRGPLILLACPPGERHDIALAAFGLMMRDRRSRIVLLGSDTPLDTLAAAAAQLRPARIVLAVTTEEPAGRLREAGPVDFGYPVSLAGSAVTPELAAAVGADLLPPEMLAAADRLAATV